mgnify:CR=1 FL=1
MVGFFLDSAHGGVKGQAINGQTSDINAQDRVFQLAVFIIPTEEEWNLAAYKETRSLPLDSFIKDKIYDYPVGSLPYGSNCLNDCKFENQLDFSKFLSRGYGHTKIKSSKRGVNGLYEMGANVWEWASIADND